MKFIFADARDQVDPNFDFQQDESEPGRNGRDDLYPHEFFASPPYDGVLVSRGIVGSSIKKGKYTDALAMQLRREGVRAVLRLTGARYRDMPIFGDCGAFSYVKEAVPPYTPEDTAEFYADCGFTHGCSPDHIIFGFRKEGGTSEKPTADEKSRYEITQANAQQFLKASRSIPGFTPVGVIQGWSPESMATAAKNLQKMGYKYLAIGGMVPLEAPDILLTVREIRAAVKASTKLHILGFAKAEQIHLFKGEGVDSFDSTSPLIRAFKDGTRNYYVSRDDGGLDYYTAVRVPQALENNKLKRLVLEGRVELDVLSQKEEIALQRLRALDRGQSKLEPVKDAVLDYLRLFYLAEMTTASAVDKKIASVERHLDRTLAEMPWKACGCEVCKKAGVEVAIFRTSNRNKRRGFHNLHVYYEHLKRVRNGIRQ